MAAQAERAALEKFRVPCALLLFAALIWLYTRHNDFPFFYHPDEPDKVAQILQDKWNFHHPAMMLVAAKAVVTALRVPRDPQHIVIAGRWLSAIYSAAGASALALLAWRMRGPLAFAAAALFVGLHHQVFELAHYFKEDAALFMGVALTFLALQIFCAKKSLAAAAFLGVACALALSAKYIGAVLLIPALPALWRAPRGSRGGVFAIFLAAFVLVAACANYPLFANFTEFKQSFHREVALAAQGQRGMTHTIPNTEYFSILAQNMNVALWLFLACFLVKVWRDRRSLDFMEWTVAVFPFAYLLMLACSPKSNDRYLLPATGLFALDAAFGLVAAAEFFGRKISTRVALATCFAIAAACQLFSLVKYAVAFAHDDRRELTAWILAQLPAHALIAQDDHADLPVAARPSRLPWQQPIPQRVIENKKDFDDFSQLKRDGVNYFVASESDYGRYFRRAGKARVEYRGEYEQRRAFYDELFARGEKLWSRPRGTVIYLHPGLAVYRLQ